MRTSLKGHALPETLEEFNHLKKVGFLLYDKCLFCDQEFEGRTRTKLGWAETQISGSCEDCFMELTKEDD